MCSGSRGRASVLAVHRVPTAQVLSSSQDAHEPLREVLVVQCRLELVCELEGVVRSNRRVLSGWSSACSVSQRGCAPSIFR